MRADLHCHSHYSDGKHAPAFLLERAAEKGLSHLAITDHDCVEAHLQPLPDQGITVVTGVEISCLWQEREIHVVGLGLNVQDAALQSLLASQQAARLRRIGAISAKLEKQGISGLEDYVHALPCKAATRTHAGDFLVQGGHSKTLQKAFKKYLGRKGNAYVPGQWCQLDTALATIHGAGGISVLAHPSRYALSKRQLQDLIAGFSAAGGAAAEVSYGNVDPASQKRLIELANEQGLYLSQGSDFHDRAASWTDIGKFPALPTSAIKNAIWEHPGWHFS